MDREVDRRIGAAAAVMRSMYQSVVVKKELSQKAKLSIYQSIYVPTLTYGHELWVMTERVRSRIQAAEMSFLRRVAGRSLRDRVRSSVTREEGGVEPLLLHIEREQVEVAWASVLDASGTSPWGGIPGMPHCEEAPGKTQDTLERLCRWAGLGTPRGPSERAGGSVWGEGAERSGRGLTCASREPFDAKSTRPTATDLHVPRIKQASGSVKTTPIPSSHDTIPSSHDTIPSSHDTIPSSHDPIPSSHDTIPSSHDTIPSSHDPIPSSHDPIPSSHDTIPSSHDTIPSSHDTIPSSHDTIPPVTTPSPPVTTPSPPVTTPSPPVTTPSPPVTTPSPPVTTPSPPVTTPSPPVTTPSPPVTTPSPPVTTPSPPVTTPSPPVTTPSPPVTTPSPPVTTPSPPVTTPSPPVTTPSPPVTTPSPPEEFGWFAVATDRAPDTINCSNKGIHDVYQELRIKTGLQSAMMRRSSVLFTSPLTAQNIMVDQMVGCSPIMRKARVRFPANASTPATGCSASPKPGKMGGI
ncbi:hypothetical protein QTP70_011925 [Hemibagrus guttatus]|uniref:Uncharacterized protein n=1 Tax=Hemibagrus guttatus TaxID=175788 RepID=A0AAE0RII1_9TELE|nr:hypothetical protein QTP70_011925 [Hemibagrus guttatus]